MIMHNPSHPGEFIQQVYLDELQVNARTVAKKLGVHSSTFGRLLKGKTNISAEMALRLSKTLGRTPQSWLAMQDNYSLYQTSQKIDFSKVESIEKCI
ncbi:MAG: HigA family addiction module antidote protein [Gammaproteobacteria bacterium]|jgi:addiction module HigA family antidote|nr:HigA family addiction module antidote protein [Gammaproteobacteria bacterium]